MRQAALLIACAAALGACDGGAEVNERNASVAEVANAVRESGVANESFIRAGQWRVTGKMEDMEIPGLPPAARAQMQQMTASSDMSFEYCLTPEEAKKPQGKFFTGKEADNCRYERFHMGDGKFDAVMHCTEQGARKTTMAMTGTYSPEAYETRVTMDVDGGPQGKATMKMRSQARRVGECKPAAKQG